MMTDNWTSILKIDFDRKNQPSLLRWLFACADENFLALNRER